MSLRQVFLNRIAQTSPSPLMLEIASSEGLSLMDKSGKTYMDLISGISVSYLGHNHPKVIEAIKEQVDRYLHTMVYGEFVLSPQVEYADLLCSYLPDSLSAVYFVNSGAEAVEGALKLAKRLTRRPKIVAMRSAYHGSTHGALSLNSESYFTQAFAPLLPGVMHITFNEASELTTIDEQTAAVIVEPVKAESGIHVPLNDYLKKLRARCHEVGALLIFDEIQTGLGRTGHLFAFEKYGVTPDVLLLAKAFGGGMPLGAFVASQEMMNHFTHDPVLGHITTFGGHPVSCAAGLAAFKELLVNDYVAQVSAKEEYVTSILSHGAIKEVRSAGLWFAIDLGSSEQVMKVVQMGLEEGILVDWFLFNDQSIRLAPPLNISMEEIEIAIDVLMRILDRIRE